MQPSSSIAERLASVRRAIAEAALSAGRHPDEVRLIAVSKQQDAARVRAAFDAGQTQFGESFLQEAAPKIKSLADLAIDWHYIGALQSNKAKYLPACFTWIHSLGSLSAARRLSTAAQPRTKPLAVLIEVNTGRDPAKHGMTPEDLPPFIEAFLTEALEMIELRGLMTIGPQTNDERVQHRTFAALRVLADRCRSNFALPRFDQLSMGMSSDFVPAIHEGATFVRIGHAVFGARTRRQDPVGRAAT